MKLEDAFLESCDLTYTGSLLRNSRALSLESEALAMDPALK